MVCFAYFPPIDAAVSIQNKIISLHDEINSQQI